jgi:hypothetical protein
MWSIFYVDAGHTSNCPLTIKSSATGTQGFSPSWLKFDNSLNQFEIRVQDGQMTQPTISVYVTIQAQVLTQQVS